MASLTMFGYMYGTCTFFSPTCSDQVQINLPYIIIPHVTCKSASRCGGAKTKRGDRKGAKKEIQISILIHLERMDFWISYPPLSNPIYMYIHICIYAYVYIHIYIYICIHIALSLSLSLSLSTHICVCIHIYIYIYIYIYMHTYLYIYIYMPFPFWQASKTAPRCGSAKTGRS